ncbi:hypothetical protein ADICYQ_4007 [Cyclobacterium qasimii M12-11B]|uniref:Uncharacterized protein n=1 Tax=Cyclobacterium qasimii M12-11B TaxID=641524 RepID=S7VAF2_9BACT|nr:hypothetical protein ADICYQ_4007 [Cyclobacterium qasimii M12-11B]
MDKEANGAKSVNVPFFLMKALRFINYRGFWLILGNNKG